MAQVLQEHAESILFFGGLAVFSNWIAWSRGFYELPAAKKSTRLSPTLVQVLAAFAIYLGTTLLLVPLLARLLFLFSTNTHSAGLPITWVSYLQLFSMLLAGLILFVFCKLQNPTLNQMIWKDPTIEPKRSPLFDFSFGVMAWIIAFPPVAVIGQISDLLLYVFFGVEHYEQVAVRYLKMTLGSPSLLLSALFLILIAAPILEELLFRGFLQSHLKAHVGAKSAILITALCFALFHLSVSQGLGNISLAITLFCFACFLGFIYERQGSLFASIGLHTAFNAVSSFRILFLPES